MGQDQGRGHISRSTGKGLILDAALIGTDKNRPVFLYSDKIRIGAVRRKLRVITDKTPGFCHSHRLDVVHDHYHMGNAGVDAANGCWCSF